MTHTNDKHSVQKLMNRMCLHSSTGSGSLFVMPKKGLPTKTVRSPLSDAEACVINPFIHFARLLGIPKSVAEIYGFLFVSENPHGMEEIMGKLNLSKGSASQGLSFLRRLGAVKTVYVPGDRKDYFQAELELRLLLKGILREQLLPHLERTVSSLDRVEKMFPSIPSAERERLKNRVAKLRSWEQSARGMLPLIEQLLQK